jgi:hypothetical protein
MEWGGPHGRRCSIYNSAGVIIIALLTYTRTLVFLVYVSSALLLTPALLKHTGNLIHWTMGAHMDYIDSFLIKTDQN